MQTVYDFVLMNALTMNMVPAGVYDENMEKGRQLQHKGTHFKYGVHQ